LGKGFPTVIIIQNQQSSSTPSEHSLQPQIWPNAVYPILFFHEVKKT
jgi:hypothetical protein